MSTDTLANLATETRSFAPDPAFAAQANADASLYAAADADRLAFWDSQARRLDWATPWEQVLDWSNAPFARWFTGGTLNVAHNCVDRHVAAGIGDRVALIFEAEDGSTEHITYADLQARVSQAANALEGLGVTAGDRVAIYLSMTPHAVVAMLACARIGAVHSVVFGGFAAEALRTRIDDAGAKLVITADGQYRRGQSMALKPAVDEAIVHCPSVEHVLVVQRTGEQVDWVEGRDVWWHEWVPIHPTTHEAQAFDAEHPLFILYTSGTTGQAQGDPAHHRRLPHPGRVDAQQRLRPQAGDRRLLVHGRHRLGDRALLHRLRPAGQRRDPGHLRGHPGHPAPGPVLGDHRQARRDHPLHRTDCDPHVHEVGCRPARGPRPELAAAARLGR